MVETSHSTSSNHASPSVTKLNFILEDIPPTKWPERVQEFNAWLKTRKLTEKSNYIILIEFVSRFTGMLRDWWISISQTDHTQILILQDFL